MITVKRESDLETQTWKFWYDDRAHALLLSSWDRERRATVRHMFRLDAQWSTGFRGDRPSIPPDVLDEARRQFVETLKVEP